jgi:hypothetical protein
MGWVFLLDPSCGRVSQERVRVSLGRVCNHGKTCSLCMRTVITLGRTGRQLHKEITQGLQRD